MAEAEKFVDVFNEYHEIYGHGRFHFDDLTAGIELLEDVLRKTDSDIRGSLLRTTHLPSGSFGNNLTDYGQRLMFSGTCARLLLSLSRREGINEETERPGRSLFFVYALYWRIGEDFLFGNIVERNLRDAGTPPEHIDGEWIGFEIWREMWKLWKRHYQPPPRVRIVVASI
jgi:hypothetical protein